MGPRTSLQVAMKLMKGEDSFLLNSTKDVLEHLLRRGFFHPPPPPAGNLYIYNFFRIRFFTKYFQVCLALNCVKASETLALAASEVAAEASFSSGSNCTGSHSSHLSSILHIDM